MALLTTRYVLPILLLAACDDGGSTRDEAGDGADSPFLVEGKADVAGIEDGSAAACAVLKLASTADTVFLDKTARLNAQAARSIYATRIGPDGQPGTADDVWFDSLEQLDAVRWVGRQAFRRMLDYTVASGFTCGQVNVQLLAFNDFHGNLKPPSGSSGRIVIGPDPAVNRVDAGGVEFMATHMAERAAANPNTVVVAAGDIIGATPLLSALFHDEPTIESMNLMGLDVAAVGNHEFDEGAAELLRMQDGGCHPVEGCLDGDGFAGAAFQYLAANVIEDATGNPLLAPYTVRRFGGTRVAFIGMTLEGTPLVSTPAGTQGLMFLDEAETANALVPELQAQGIETIVVLLHEGGFTSGRFDGCEGISGPLFEVVSRLDPAIDVVVGGHTNAAHLCDIQGMLVTSAASFGRLITDIDLVIDEVTGDVVSHHAENVIVTRTVGKDVAQTGLIARYDALAAPLANRVIGQIAGDLLRAGVAGPGVTGESTLGNVIADAQRAASAGVQIAFMNPGGIRTELVFAQISGGEQPGDVTYGESFAVQPFSNNLVTLNLTGAQVLTALEQQWQLVGGTEKANILATSQGFVYTWDAAAPLGSRVVPGSAQLNGQAIDPVQLYRITVNSFLADGGDGFAVFKLGTDRTGGALDVDALEQWLTTNSPLSPPALGRVSRVN